MNYGQIQIGTNLVYVAHVASLLSVALCCRCWGEPSWRQFSEGAVRAAHGLPLFSCAAAGALALDRAFGVLQREAQFLRQPVDRRALPFPRAVALEAQRADAAAPRRDDAADRARIRPLPVLLVDLLEDVGRHADERTQGGG